MTGPDTILWLNHAGYELRTSGLRIVHDPWWRGTAFDEGWALVADSVFTPGDFAGVDYLWLSHEHPDHFDPALLNAIDPEVRRTITVLFQRTPDERVARFCRELGFTVRELGNRERVALGADVFVTCGVVGDDSWLFTETPERTYLNTNDVVGVDWRRLGAQLARPVDVLFAQFSYASGIVGGIDQMRAAAERQIGFIKDQLAAFTPKLLIPFASYMWFCQAENFHLNAGANRVDDVVARLATSAPTVVLYPGDHWRVGAARDNGPALARYRRDWQRHANPLAPRAPVPIEQLEQLSREHHDRLASANRLWMLRPLRHAGFIRPVGIWLEDLGRGVRYDMLAGGITKMDLALSGCDVAISSRGFASLLRHARGMGTLMVNGCFAALRTDGLRRLSRHFALPGHNGRGDYFPDALLRTAYLRRNARRIGTALARHIAA